MAFILEGKSFCLILGLILSFYGDITWSLSTGAPEGNTQLCQNLLPQHDKHKLQESRSSLYTMRLSKSSLNGGETLELQLQAPKNLQFKGFLVAIKQSQNSTESLGTFKIQDGYNNYSQTISCPGGTNNLVTHKTSEDKASVILHWVAPNKDLNNLEVMSVINKSLLLSCFRTIN